VSAASCERRSRSPNNAVSNLPAGETPRRLVAAGCQMYVLNGAVGRAWLLLRAACCASRERGVCPALSLSLWRCLSIKSGRGAMRYGAAYAYAAKKNKKTRGCGLRVWPLAVVRCGLWVAGCGLRVVRRRDAVTRWEDHGPLCVEQRTPRHQGPGGAACGRCSNPLMHKTQNADPGHPG
jgi:hypothetical protein